MLIINKASAGSGKTYNLVYEFIKMLLGYKPNDSKQSEYKLKTKLNNEHSKILAITFTNKATEEMKQRIVKELGYMAHKSEKSDHLKGLAEAFGVSEDKVCEAAAIAHTQILIDYANFNVSTIDSFFQTVLRTFAFDVDLPSDFTIELSDEFAIAVGIGDLKRNMRTSNKNDYLSEWIREYVTNTVNSGKSWDVLKDTSGEKTKIKSKKTLSDFAKYLTNEKVKKHLGKLREWITESDGANLKALNECLDDISESLSKEIRAFGDYCYKNYDKLNLNDHKKSPAVSLQGYKASTKVDKKFIEKYPELDSWRKKATTEKAATEFSVWLEKVRTALKRKAAVEAISENIYRLGLLYHIDNNIKNYNNENNTILLSNTNDILKDVIGGDNAPYVYARLGTFICNYLIDEFQDTSRMQWENLEPLLQDSLSAGHDNLIIGDIKQSIYRFRNSDPHLLGNEVEKSFGSYKKGDCQSKNVNWRSYKDIVEFNNDVFEYLAKELGLYDEFYSNIHQEVSTKHKETPGYVRYELLEEENVEKFKEQATAKTIETIYDMLNRGYEQRDIAILVNTNTEGEQIIKALLQEEGINVVSEESLLIGTSSAVSTVITLLNAIDRTAQPGTSAETEKKRKEKLTPKELLFRYQYLLFTEGDSARAFQKALDNTSDIDLSKVIKGDEPVTLDVIVDRILKHFVGQKTLDEEMTFVLAFKDLVADYMETFGSNVHFFLKWWNKVGSLRSVSSPSDINAIQVMTIHKSKGLEFQGVIIPFCNWKIDRDSIEWIETDELNELKKFFKEEGKEHVKLPPILPITRNELNTSLTEFSESLKKCERDAKMDILNKMYVAFTRAKQELVMFAGAKTKAAKTKAAKTEAKEQNLRELLTPYLTGGNKEVYERGCKTDKVTESDKKPDDNEITPNKHILEHLQIIPPLRDTEDKGIKYKVPELITRLSNPKQFDGTAMHNIMQRVKTAGDLGSAIGYYYKKSIINDEEQKRYGRILAEALKDPQVEEWFSEDVEVLNETEILGYFGDPKNEEYLQFNFETRRPDRVVCTKDGRTIVIDYKFGDKKDEYHMQVRHYMDMLAEIGYKRLEGYLWYVPSGEIVKVERKAIGHG
ncbi:MAG: UvrD-helicase domain-containing protein [Candidatus Limisoma sp.]|nr:UvrD-helicase domain-containing protein [Candidatus Limisoma sp.]